MTKTLMKIRIKRSRTALLVPLMTMSALGLSSCANLSKTGLATTAVTSGVTLAATGNAIVATGVAAAGIGTDYVVNEDKADERTVSKLETLPADERTAYLKSMEFWNAFKDLGYFGIVATFLFFAVPYCIGYFIPTRRRKTLEKLVFNHPEIKSGDLK